MITHPETFLLRKIVDAPKGSPLLRIGAYQFNYNQLKPMMRPLFIALIIIVFTSCADEKDIVLNGQLHTFEPYGWANMEEVKNDSITYQLSKGNIVWSFIGVETIVVPVWLTGWYLYEPVRAKIEFIKSDTSYKKLKQFNY